MRHLICGIIVLVACSAYSTFLWLGALSALFYIGFHFLDRFVPFCACCVIVVPVYFSLMSVEH